jgi:hypothetical protein
MASGNKDYPTYLFRDKVSHHTIIVKCVFHGDQNCSEVHYPKRWRGMKSAFVSTEFGAYFIQRIGFWKKR